MSCTLEELQAVEYEILCAFADFCEKHDIKYTLAYGTLLGAIRHNGFIPWDDDVDVLMDINEFNKLKRIISKSPINGYDFCWIDDKKEYYPFHFAKLRKSNTYMPEPALRSIKMKTGVWIDIFVYIDKPKTSIGIKLQEIILSVFHTISRKYANRIFRSQFNDTEMNHWLFDIVDKCPDGLLRFVRRVLYFIIAFTGVKNSDFVRVYDYDSDDFFSVNRRFLEPVTKHVFVDREFYISENYDELLRTMYGDDYMTPIKSHVHAHLDEIEL